MTFERFLASLYMTAMLQLGLMHEQGGQPRIDLIGARQTIDTLSLFVRKDQRQPHCRRGELPSELPVRTTHGVCRSDQRAGPSAPNSRLRAPQPRNDEGHAHGAGQRHVDGSAHHRVRLRGVPVFGPPRPSYASLGDGGIGETHASSSTALPTSASRRSVSASTEWTLCYTPMAMPTTSSGSTICARSAIIQPDRLPLYVRSEGRSHRNVFQYIFDEDYKYGGLQRSSRNHSMDRWICSARILNPSP